MKSVILKGGLFRIFCRLYSTASAQDVPIRKGSSGQRIGSNRVEFPGNAVRIFEGHIILVARTDPSRQISAALAGSGWGG